MFILLFYCLIQALSPRSGVSQLKPIVHLNTFSSSTYEEAIMNIGQVQLPYSRFHVNDLQNALQAFSIVYDRCFLVYEKHHQTTLLQVHDALNKKLYHTRRILGRVRQSPFETPQTLSTFLLTPKVLNIPPIVLREEPSPEPLLYKKGYLKHLERRKKIRLLIIRHTFSSPFSHSFKLFNQLAPHLLLNQPLPDDVFNEFRDFIGTACYAEIVEFLAELAIQVLAHPNAICLIRNYRHYYLFYYYLYHLLNALEAHELAICLAREMTESVSNPIICDLFEALYTLDKKAIEQHTELKNFSLYPSVQFTRRRNLVFGTIVKLKYEFLHPDSTEHPFLETYGVIRTNFLFSSYRTYSVVERASIDVFDYFQRFKVLDVGSLVTLLSKTWEHILVLQKVSVVNFDHGIENCLMYHDRANSEQCLNDFDVSYFYSNPNPNFTLLLFIMTHSMVRLDHELDIPLFFFQVTPRGLHSNDPFKYRVYELIYVIQLLANDSQKKLPSNLEKRERFSFLLPFACQLVRTFYHSNHQPYLPIIQKWVNFMLSGKLQKHRSYPLTSKKYCSPLLLNQKQEGLILPFPLPPPLMRSQKSSLYRPTNGRPFKVYDLSLPAVPLSLQLSASPFPHTPTASTLCLPDVKTHKCIIFSHTLKETPKTGHSFKPIESVPNTFPLLFQSKKPQKLSSLKQNKHSQKKPLNRQKDSCLRASSPQFNLDRVFMLPPINEALQAHPTFA